MDEKPKKPKDLTKTPKRGSKSSRSSGQAGADAGASARQGKAAAWRPPDDGLIRCPWALSDPLSLEYHDHRWGRITRDEVELFKMLTLEGLQAGLSWRIILNKEKAILEAFEGLDPHKVALFGPEKVEELALNPNIIRNRLKITSIIGNAKAYLNLIKETGTFANYLWSFVDNQPIVGTWREMSEIPVTNEISDRLSKDLKKRGFKFVGGQIAYSLMEAVGLVNDHLVNCAFRFPED
jgi:DNA-3-methyladenine glycosylase I